MVKYAKIKVYQIHSLCKIQIVLKLMINILTDESETKIMSAG